MKKILLQVIILFTCLNSSFGQTYKYDSIQFDSRWRTFMTYLPQGYNSSLNYPLVLAFHGGGSPSYQSLQYRSRLSLKADTAGFILVYPEGVSVGGSRTWNAGGCCAPATTLHIDDVGFVNALLDTLIKHYPIDQTRVYGTGFSNGAILCYRLANELTDRFAAIAPVEGDLMDYPWNPSRAIPIISIHSYQDQNIPYFGGTTTGPSGSYYPPQDSMFNIIGSNYSCSFMKDTLYHNISQYDHFKYYNCSCNSVIEQWVSYDGSHSWAGGLPLSGNPVSTQFSATYLMWNFFQNYTVGCNSTTGLLQSNNQSNQLQLFPNPTNGMLTVDLTSGDFTISIWDQNGRKIKEQSFSGKCELNCSDLQEGLYFLQARNGKGNVTGRFVKK